MILLPDLDDKLDSLNWVIQIKMITQQKFKLFQNDPKFRGVPLNNRHAQQIAIQKVYAGQKQLRRKVVIMDSIAKKSNPNLAKPDLDLDFLESRIHAFQMMLAEDIQKMYQQVQFIKETHEQSKSIEQLIDNKLKMILSKADEIDSLTAQREEEQLKIVEQAVSQIEELFKENKRLKEENAEIASRIEKRKGSVTKKSNKSNVNFKFEKR